MKEDANFRTLGTAANDMLANLRKRMDENKAKQEQQKQAQRIEIESVRK